MCSPAICESDFSKPNRAEVGFDIVSHDAHHFKPLKGAPWTTVATLWELENGHRKFVDLAIKNSDFPQLCKRLPEGIYIYGEDIEFPQFSRIVFVSTHAAA